MNMAGLPTRVRQQIGSTCRTGVVARYRWRNCPTLSQGYVQIRQSLPVEMTWRDQVLKMLVFAPTLCKKIMLHVPWYHTFDPNVFTIHSDLKTVLAPSTAHLFLCSPSQKHLRRDAARKLQGLAGFPLGDFPLLAQPRQDLRN